LVPKTIYWYLINSFRPPIFCYAFFESFVEHNVLSFSFSIHNFNQSNITKRTKTRHLNKEERRMYALGTTATAASASPLHAAAATGDISEMKKAIAKASSRGIFRSSKESLNIDIQDANGMVSRNAFRLRSPHFSFFLLLP
jgi:hypothetical protein